MKERRGEGKKEGERDGVGITCKDIVTEISTLIIQAPAHKSCSHTATSVYIYIPAIPTQAQPSAHTTGHAQDVISIQQTNAS